ncbi:hypothetical protein ACH4E8_31800 [Streptomyces sp. NPDC017979]|uniref:hypothetical protein n=1 Tax=unclassified Streptomyces TaxID=2593676 RepID=UPI003791260E
MSATTLLAGISRTTEPTVMLRRFLGLDAVVTGTNGIAYIAASGPLGRLLGVDAGVLLGVGIVILAYGLGVALVAARREPHRAAVTAVVDINLVYAVVSIVSVLLWFEPTTAGAVWIPLQALVVAGFAVAQWASLRAVLKG